MNSLELDDTTLDTLEVPRRVIVVGSRAGVLVQALSRRGLLPQQVRAEQLLSAIDAHRPHAVLVCDVLDEEPRAGRQLALALRAQGRTFSIPVVGVLPHIGVPTVFRWLEVGAVDVWREDSEADLPSRLHSLIAECESSAVHTAALSVRLLAFMRRNQLSGSARAYAGTPFEGYASFVDGQLIEATFGHQEGQAALEEMLELDAEAITWLDATVVTQPMAAAAVPVALGRPPTVLVVEDVDTIALLVRRTLEGAGYQVDVASDGQQGLQAALERPYDLLVADLNLPRLDGWGLMRLLREDPVGRESAVLVLSAQDQLVDALKAARAGARAYLKKSGKAKVLLDTMALLARPRTLAWSSLSLKLPTTMELKTVGPVWLLRALAELDCMGELFAEDELSRVELRVCQGQLVDSVAQVGSHRVLGERALEVLLSMRGTARFEPKDVEAPGEAPWVFDAVQRACDAHARDSKARLAALVADPGALALNPELAEVFANIASRRQLAVLDRLSRGPVTFERLVAEVQQSEDEVKQALAELVRRGVLTPEGP